MTSEIHTSKLEELRVVHQPLARHDQAEKIAGTTRILRVLSDTDNVDTQGPVWLVGGKTL